MKSTSKFFALPLALVLSMSVAACSQDDESPSKPVEENEAPVLPPSDVMDVDLAAFGTAGSDAAKVKDEPAPSDSSNYVVAVATAVTIDAAVLAGLAPASVALAGAFLVSPVEQEDGSFLWAYQAAYEPYVFDLELTGKKDGSEVVWALRVTTDDTEPPLTDFLWYDGRCGVLPLEGFWQFYDPTQPDEEIPLARLDWIRESAVDREAAFLVNRPGSAVEGDRLEYRQDGTAAFMEYLDASTVALWDIQWDIETEAGSLLVPYYHQGERACWDEAHLNVTCP